MKALEVLWTAEENIPDTKAAIILNFWILHCLQKRGDGVLTVCFPLMYPGAATSHPVHFHENMTSPLRQQKLSSLNSQMLHEGEQRNGRPLLNNELDNAGTRVFVWTLYKFSWGKDSTEWFGKAWVDLKAKYGQKMCCYLEGQTFVLQWC